MTGGGLSSGVPRIGGEGGGSKGSCPSYICRTLKKRATSNGKAMSWTIGVWARLPLDRGPDRAQMGKIILQMSEGPLESTEAGHAGV